MPIWKSSFFLPKTPEYGGKEKEKNREKRKKKSIEGEIQNIQLILQYLYATITPGPQERTFEEKGEKEKGKNGGKGKRDQ